VAPRNRIGEPGGPGSVLGRSDFGALDPGRAQRAAPGPTSGDLGSGRLRGGRGCYLYRVTVQARPAPAEGRSTWLGVAAIAAAFLVFALWVVFAGTSPGKIAGSFTAEAALTLEAGQSRHFAADAMATGTVVACISDGLRVKAYVPPPGRSLKTHVDSAYGGGATIRVRTLSGGSVVVGCTR
jgi:hypothetical protein